MGCSASSSLRHKKLDEIEDPFNVEEWIGKAFRLSINADANQTQWSALLHELQKASRYDWSLLDHRGIFTLILRYISKLSSLHIELDPVLSTWVIHVFTHLPNKSEGRLWKMLPFVSPLWVSLSRSPKNKSGKRLLNLLVMVHQLFVKDCEELFASSLSDLLGEKVRTLWVAWPPSVDLRCVALIGLTQTTDPSTISLETLTKRRKKERDLLVRSIMDSMIEYIQDTVKMK